MKVEFNGAPGPGCMSFIISEAGGDLSTQRLAQALNGHMGMMAEVLQPDRVLVTLDSVSLVRNELDGEEPEVVRDRVYSAAWQVLRAAAA